MMVGGAARRQRWPPLTLGMGKAWQREPDRCARPLDELAREQVGRGGKELSKRVSRIGQTGGSLDTVETIG